MNDAQKYAAKLAAARVSAQAAEAHRRAQLAAARNVSARVALQPRMTAAPAATPTFEQQATTTATQTASAVLASSGIPTYQKALLGIAGVGLLVKIFAAVKK
jgi:hypothetical protein